MAPGLEPPARGPIWSPERSAAGEAGSGRWLTGPSNVISDAVQESRIVALCAKCAEQTMVLDINVDYKAPSWERLFLGKGWGVRDIRRPYITDTTAQIVIDNWALSPKTAATVKLTLAVSNRCEVDALFVRAIGVFGSAQNLVKRNDEATLTISNVFADPIRKHAVILLEPTFGVNGIIAATPGTIDIVALNELRLTR